MPVIRLHLGNSQSCFTYLLRKQLKCIGVAVFKFLFIFKHLFLSNGGFTFSHTSCSVNNILSHCKHKLCRRNKHLLLKIENTLDIDCIYNHCIDCAYTINKLIVHMQSIYCLYIYIYIYNQFIDFMYIQSIS